ncbi:LytR/AlgR family response regulator transcription factor [Anaerostipes sp.]|uniref:LytR/AlgR family response regulator transcription factor n=1 Tax=Anaerostipes sp. TaxID=1872530 RepID=UPI0025BB81F5|nr:LytTR family DNA-binding domain-containing protein [Anaerostipes sp.]MBS7009472.1 response regulator transcription factor [Anaerostipes sp.]
MYRIGICDDDKVFLDHLGQKIKEIMIENGLKYGIDFEIEQFSEALQMNRIIQGDRDHYQLLLLDIELSKENGMELARAFRKQQVTCSIIFITSYRDYVFDCFDTQPLWYLLKPIDTEKFEEILLSDYRRSYADTRLAVKIGGRNLAIPFSDIYALEATQHRTRIWLFDEFQDWNGALSKLKPLMPSYSFCQSHNSYMINLSHVIEIQRSDAVMDNGRAFPISRRYFDHTMEKYFTYLKI